MVDSNFSLPSVDIVRTKLSYDPITGVFSWVKPRKIKHCGIIYNGRLEINVGGKRHRAHRLAWLMSTGRWPEGVVDHKNGNPFDNRLCNLRDVPHSANSQNQRKAQKSNVSTGVLGVTMRKNGRFQVRSASGDKNLNVGTFITLKEASDAYIEAKRRLHPGCTI